MRTSWRVRNSRKPQDKEPTHLLEKTTSKKLTIPNASKDAERQELSRIADGNAKCHLGRQSGSYSQS